MPRGLANAEPDRGKSAKIGNRPVHSSDVLIFGGQHRTDGSCSVILNGPAFEVLLFAEIQGAIQMRIQFTHSARNRDSLLTPMGATRPIDLMLQYRLRLVRCEPTTRFNVDGVRCQGDGVLRDGPERFQLEPWSDGEWTRYRDAFVPMITRFWDAKFALTPNRPWYSHTGPAGTAQATEISCSLSLGLIDANPHLTYYIIKPRELGFRSMVTNDRRLGVFTHRDLSVDSATRTTRVGPARHNVDYFQCTVLHEFGHTLGLNHVNGDANNDHNYGVSLEQRHDLMGLGGHVSSRAARPWISQLRHHLIPQNAADRSLRFNARVVAPQIITYWDNDWRPTAPAR